MILTRAIEILSASVQGSTTHSAEFKKALKLGIEAMKRLQEHRYEHIDITYRALPGETGEER